ncbi:MAG: LytTR family transcriptional regulator [Pedobacter sp.]|nr:MAG: LytTR family transcriptional regulator [Pedobacter sp.]
MLATIQIYFSKRNSHHLAILIGCVVIIFSSFQHLLHSSINGYAFYLSESLLFSTFWLLFLPFLILQRKILVVPMSLGINKVRYGVSIFLATLTHLLLFPMLIWVLSSLFFNHTYSYDQTLMYALSDHLYTCIIIYSGVAFFHFHLNKEEDADIAKITKLSFNSGRTYINVHLDEIIYIASASPYIAVHTKEQYYLFSETLKEIETKLDATRFMRIHKSTIINLDMIISYHSRLNGDYDIMLINGASVRLSRNYSIKFKSKYHSFHPKSSSSQPN